MADKSAIEALIAKIEAADRDTPLIASLEEVFGDGCWPFKAFSAIGGDKNDAVSLAAHVLPGWHWGMHSRGAWVCEIGSKGKKFACDGEPARSLVICILKAMIWELDNA